MKHGMVTALAILLVMGAIVHKGDSFIRAGREMIDNKERGPQQSVEDYYERLAAPPPQWLFKKGQNMLSERRRGPWEGVSKETNSNNRGTKKPLRERRVLFSLSLAVIFTANFWASTI